MPNTIVVAGGGVAGMNSALQLASKADDVVYLVSPDLGGTFACTPGRNGLGYHYFDPDTAKFYLRWTVEFRRRYPAFLIDHNQPHEKGLYVIVKASETDGVSASVKSPEEIRAVYQAISCEYRRLVERDRLNAVYGDPKHFLVELRPDQYPAHINPRLVAAVFQTQEVLVNVEEYLRYLREQIERTPNIRLRVGETVTKIQHGHTILDKSGSTLDSNFVVFVQKAGGAEEQIRADQVVNATWQNAELLAETLVPGNYMEQQRGHWVNTMDDKPHWVLQGGEKRQNRLKVLVRFRLPDSLREANSVFFCMGSHCMFSNNGDLGKGYAEGHLTAAEITNIKTSTALMLEGDMERLLSGRATATEKRDYAIRLFIQAARYISMLPQTPADIERYVDAGLKSGEIELRFGIVQTFGPSEENMDDLRSMLSDPASSINKRNELRVDPAEPVLGVTRALALKGGSYGPVVGIEVVKAVAAQENDLSMLQRALETFAASYQQRSAEFYENKLQKLLDVQGSLRSILAVIAAIESVSFSSARLGKKTRSVVHGQGFFPSSPGTSRKATGIETDLVGNLQPDFKYRVEHLLTELSALYHKVAAHVHEVTTHIPPPTPHSKVLGGVIKGSIFADARRELDLSLFWFCKKQLVIDDITTGPADKVLKECYRCIDDFAKITSPLLSAQQSFSRPLSPTYLPPPVLT